MFKVHTRHKKIRNANLDELVLKPQIQLVNKANTWSAFDISGSPLSNSYIIDTPKFTNLQWVQTISDYPDGELCSLLFLGLLRGESRTVNLYGDYNNQSINLSAFVKKDILEDMKKRYSSHESCYNKDSSMIQGIDYFLDGLSKGIPRS